MRIVRVCLAPPLCYHTLFTHCILFSLRSEIVGAKQAMHHHNTESHPEPSCSTNLQVQGIVD